MTPKTLFCSDHRPSLEEARAFVGGYVELIYLPGGNQLLVRDDALLVKGLETNVEATALAQSSGLRISSRGIVGNVMVLSGNARWLPEA